MHMHMQTHMHTHMLASIEIPPLTQARASGDYHPGNDQWQPLGTTGLFAWAIGVAPSKDNYWSTQWQPGSKWGDTTNEPYNRLQAAVITLSKGPVCPSDAIGKSDVPLIMRSAMSDGTLLQPARPATQIDATFAAKAFGHNTPDGEIWFAPSVVSGRRYGVLLSAVLKAPYGIKPETLGYPAGYELVAVESNASSTAVVVSAASPLSLMASGKYDFSLWNLSPREPNGWALLGEVGSKWVGVSPARVQQVYYADTQLTVTVRGAVSETVSIAFASPGSSDHPAGKVVTVDCVIPSGGTARANVPSATCVAD